MQDHTRLAASTSGTYRRPLAQVAGIVILLALFLGLLSVFLPPGGDWHSTFYPATRAFWSGRNPYLAVSNFTNPVWALIPLGPLALNATIGSAGMILVTIASCTIAVRYYGGSSIDVILFLTMPLSVFMFGVRNIDWLPLLGTMFAPQFGLVFVVIKPQVGFGLALYWLACSWRTGGLPRTVRTFSLLGILYLASFVVYGPPNYNHMSKLVAYGWNLGALFWPYGSLFSIALVVIAVKTNSRRYALLASPYFFPYFSPLSWNITLIALANRRWIVITIWLATWGFVIHTMMH